VVCSVPQIAYSAGALDKRRILHEHGVSQYWLVDLEVPLLTVLRHHSDGYLILSTVAPGEMTRLEPFDAVELEVARLFGDLG
jgi:Uma2 family endonuclease